EVGLYQFAHALMQETLTSELSANRTVRLHARIAEALEEFYGDAADEKAAELAEHFAEAETVLGSGKLVHYLALAGEESLALFDNQTAKAQFARALASLEHSSMDDTKAALTFNLGRAIAATAPEPEMQGAVDNLAIAFDYYASSGQHAKAIDVAATQLPTVARLQGVAEMARKGLALCDPESLQYGRLLSRYAIGMFFEHGDLESALDSADRAVEIARKHDDQLTEMFALIAKSVALEHSGRGADVLAIVPRSIELAVLNNDPSAEAHIRFYASYDEVRAGHLQLAREHAERAVELSDRYRLTYRLLSALSVALFVAAVEGDWNTVRSIFARSSDIDPNDHRILDPTVQMMLFIGEFEEAREILSRWRAALDSGQADQHRGGVAYANLIAEYSMATGDLDELEVAEAHIEANISAGDTPGVRNQARMADILVAMARNSIAKARSLFEELAIDPGKPMPGEFIGASVVSRLAYFVREISIAEQLFQRNIRFFRDAGYKPFVALESANYAQLLLDRDAPGDREKATEFQDEAIAIATELGMNPLLERVLAQREILKA
ncbi:MAG: hypothetical protein IIA09_19355, partial [Proteobacteria bacterium]|nr:hypothetical protein [Pseudomonadota bacterium]